MKLLLEKKAHWFLPAAAIAVLLFVYFLLNTLYINGPTSTYYKLANAMEQADRIKIAELAGPAALQKLDDLARHCGGMKKFGRSLKQATEVESALHMITTVDVFAKVNNRHFVIQFSWTPGGWKMLGVGFLD